MSKKDIITLVIATTVIIASVFAMLKILKPNSATPKESVEGEKVIMVPAPDEIDEKTYLKIYNLSDYGKPSLENIGKTDLFSN